MPNLKKKKIDNINTLSSKKTSRRMSANDFRGSEKVVGIKIGTKSKEYQDKIYYYKTAKDLKVGDKINAVMETGGTPDCVVVSVNDFENSPRKSLKDLEID